MATSSRSSLTGFATPATPPESEPERSRPAELAEAPEPEPTAATAETEAKDDAEPEPDPEEGKAAAAPPLRFVRQGTGWESFQCGCGFPVQIAPGFRGTNLRCRKCRATIDVLDKEPEKENCRL